MIVSILDFPDVECNNFVRGMVGAKLSHMPAWTNMVEKTFGHKGFYLVAREGGSVCGVLPLTHVRSRLFGNRMISQAFSNYGGPLTKNSDVSEALYTHAVELASEHGCESIEFRNVEPLSYNLCSHLDKVCMNLPLALDPDKIWRSFRPEIRNRIRKAEKSGIVVTSGGLEFLEDFYRVWTMRMHQLGTPCYSQRLFESIFETFVQNSRIFVVRMGELTIGGGFFYLFNGLAQCRWAAMRVEYNQFSPNNLLYWSAIKHYCLAGVSCFDFGRSTLGSPTYEFKRRWGAEPIQLHYQYWTRPGQELALVKPDNPKYKNKVEIWKKLPLWVTRLVGPNVSRNLP